MADDSLTVRLTQDKAAAVRRLGPVESVAVDASTVAEMVAGCALFDIIDKGKAVGACALRVYESQAGRVLEMTAAAASTHAGTVAAMDEFATSEAERIKAQRLTCTTARPGLVRMLKRRGYRVAGYVMQKDL